MKTKAHNGVIHSFQILFDVSKFNSVFKLISQASCQDLPTKKKKQTGHCNRTTKEKDVKFVSNARLFNLILQLLHRQVHIYHI